MSHYFHLKKTGVYILCFSANNSSQFTFPKTIHMEISDNSKNSFLPQCIHHWEDRGRRKCHPHETGSCTNTRGRGRRL